MGAAHTLRQGLGSTQWKHAPPHGPCWHQRQTSQPKKMINSNTSCIVQHAVCTYTEVDVHTISFLNRFKVIVWCVLRGRQQQKKKKRMEATPAGRKKSAESYSQGSSQGAPPPLLAFGVSFILVLDLGWKTPRKKKEVEIEED